MPKLTTTTQQAPAAKRKTSTREAKPKRKVAESLAKNSFNLSFDQAYAKIKSLEPTASSLSVVSETEMARQEDKTKLGQTELAQYNLSDKTAFQQGV